MSDPKLGRRYAQALFNAARGEDAVSEVAGAMTDVIAPLLEDRTFTTWWRSRRIPLPDKLEAVEKAFGGVHVVVRRFLALLLTKKREEVLADAVREFGIIVDRETGVVRATLTTAVDVGEAELERFRALLKSRVGGEAVLEHAVDPELIGGFRLRYGDEVIDGSVARSLESLARRMSVGA